MNGDSDGVARRATGGGATDAAPTARPLTGSAEQYLAGIRSALSDLPAPELADILDDAGAHLADLTAELGSNADHTALVARLGTPAAYAGELRVAAGYPPAPTAAHQRSGSGPAWRAVTGLVASALLMVLGGGVANPVIVVFAALVALAVFPTVRKDGPRLPTVALLPPVRRLLDSRPAAGTPARAVADFLAGLQPAWWLVRGVVGAALVLQVLVRADPALVVLLSLVTVPGSVWLGQHTRRDRRWLWAVVPLNALAAVLALHAMLGGAPALVRPHLTVDDTVSFNRPGLWQDTFQEIRDIRPVDSAGHPLTGVYLFDQEGRPVDTSGTPPCVTDVGAPRPAVDTRPYPRGTVDFNFRTGECVTTPPGPLLVAVPSAAPTSTTSPPATAPAPAAPTEPGRPTQIQPTQIPPAQPAPPTG